MIKIAKERKAAEEKKEEIMVGQFLENYTTMAKKLL